MTLPGIPLAVPMNPSPNQGQVIPIAMWQREPLASDTKYPVGFVVVIGKNPTTGNQGDLWYLAKFVSGVPQWRQFSVTPGNPGIDTITTNDGAPAVEPDVNGNVSILGDGTFIKTAGQGPGSTTTIEPVSPFLLNVNVDAHTGPGTDPVLPSAAGQIQVTGGQVAAGTTTNALQTNSLAANAYTIQIQRSAAQTSSTVGDNGISHFSNKDFTLDSNAFVQLNGSFPSFMATVAPAYPTNVTGDGTIYTIIFNSVVFDTLSNYNSSTGIFTAPYSGIYQFNVSVAMQNCDIAMTRGFASVGGRVIFDCNIGGIAANVAGTFCGSGGFVMSLTASQTVSVLIEIDNSTKTAGINGNCVFSGALLRRT